MLLVGRLLLVGRALARILDGQRGRDDHDFACAPVLVGLQDHPGQPRVDRELGELAADAGQALLVQRAELVQQVDAVLHLPAVRRLDERERR
jgi:hypothetical protein